uniref:TLC domain-containing protein n=1 Tax=Calcidiscus leptoporus TaxID=127549 RepID=A0A7S0NXH9_9EUKA
MLAGAVTAGHAPGFKWPTSVGDGTFDVLANIAAVPNSSRLPAYWTFNLLLTALLAMHAMWYLMFWRILYRLLTKESAHDAGREEYEGDSDDE